MCLAHLCRGGNWRWTCSSVGQKESGRCPDYRCWSPSLACRTVFDLRCWHRRWDLEVPDPHPRCLWESGRGGCCGCLHQLLTPFHPRSSPTVLLLGSFSKVTLSSLLLIVFCGSHLTEAVPQSESVGVPIPCTDPQLFFADGLHAGFPPPRYAQFHDDDVWEPQVLSWYSVYHFCVIFCVISISFHNV